MTSCACRHDAEHADECECASCLCSAPNRTKKGPRVAPFVANLYKILERRDVRNIVEWVPGHSSRFVVHVVKDFCDLLSQYFQHGNWSSFTRQLTNYGFTRVTDADDAFVFENPLFVRDRPETLASVVRRTPATSAKAASTPATEQPEPPVANGTAKRARLSSPVPTPALADAAIAASVAALHVKVDVLSASVASVLQNQAQILALLQARAYQSPAAHVHSKHSSPTHHSHHHSYTLPSLFDGLDDTTFLN